MIFILLSLIVYLVFKLDWLKYLVLIGLGIAFNPVTMLVLLLAYEVTRKGIK